MGLQILIAVLGLLISGVGAETMSRSEKEQFLKKAKIVSVKDVGEGATKPKKVKLEKDGMGLTAIFKDVDLRMASETRFGSEVVDEYIDSYKYELAAYELDKMLGLGILPVVVERRINGKKGSLREWIEDVMPRYGHRQNPPDVQQEHDRMQLVWLFDYLIYNVDRRTHNLMIGPGWQPILIDHSMAFTEFQKPFRPLYRFPREVVATLRTLDRKSFDRKLSRYLKKTQIAALFQRRTKIIQLVDQQVAAKGEQAVFYSLTDF